MLFNLFDNLLIRLAPHYFKGKSSEKLHKISPHFTRIFAEMIYKLLKKGTLKNVGNQIISSSSLKIVIDFFKNKKEHTKVIDICRLILNLVPDLPGIWNALGYSLTLIVLIIKS